MKKTVALCLCAVLLALFCPVSAESKPVIEMTQTHYTALVGDTVRVRVRLNDVERPVRIFYTVYCDGDGPYETPWTASGLSLRHEDDFTFINTGSETTDTGRKRHTWVFDETNSVVFTFRPMCRGVYTIQVEVFDANHYAGMLHSIPMIVADSADAASADSAYNRALQAVADTVKPGMTDRQIAVALHDWVVKHCKYDKNYGLEGALLKHRGVCENYSELYALLCSMAGLRCRRVEALSMSHDWDIVRIDGEWLHVDCTWDDPSSELVGGSCSHKYCLLTTEEMARDHTWEDDECLYCPFPR